MTCILGGLSKDGIDKRLLRCAEKNGIKVIELESVKRHLNAYQNYDDNYCISIITEICKNFDTLSLSSKELYENILHGKDDVLSEIYQIAESVEKNRDLIANRSQEMFDTVVKLLNDEQNSMLAVGAAHLFGKYGLLETFKEAGYPVVRIHFNK